MTYIFTAARHRVSCNVVPDLHQSYLVSDGELTDCREFSTSHLFVAEQVLDEVPPRREKRLHSGESTLLVI